MESKIVLKSEDSKELDHEKLKYFLLSTVLEKEKPTLAQRLDLRWWRRDRPRHEAA